MKVAGRCGAAKMPCKGCIALFEGPQGFLDSTRDAGRTPILKIDFSLVSLEIFFFVASVCGKRTCVSYIMVHFHVFDASLLRLFLFGYTC